MDITISNEVLKKLALLRDAGYSLELDGSGRRLSSRMMTAILRELTKHDSSGITQAMLRGAVWFVAGRELKNSTAEMLVLATAGWDPAFAKDWYYLHPGPLVVDARPLHNVMIAHCQRG